MAFPDAMKQLVFLRANRQCECERHGHDHDDERCLVVLREEEAHFRHRVAVVRGGGDTYANCEMLCPECHARLPHLVPGPSGTDGGPHGEDAETAPSAA
ncbi:MAG TPA: HNH endonuclease [Solirubrobacteraceae bacterium]|nr:HNH endonuclease [Solirubrobacteraceae bacterium]